MDRFPIGGEGLAGRVVDQFWVLPEDGSATLTKEDATAVREHVLSLSMQADGAFEARSILAPANLFLAALAQVPCKVTTLGAQIGYAHLAKLAADDMTRHIELLAAEAKALIDEHKKGSNAPERD
jgi:hypothetical protein